jgi:hypothetical protein
MMNASLSLLSTLVACTFSGLVLRQFLQRRRPYQAVWSLALVCFTAGVATEAAANLRGWTVDEYRLWFLAGATLTAATLGLGSLYLALPSRVAGLAAACVFAAGAWVAVRMVMTPLAAAALLPQPGQPRPPSVTGLPIDVAVVVILLNTFGTIALVSCALWSAYHYARSHEGTARVAGNMLIATGALIVGSSGSLARLGRPGYLFAGELAGIAIIFGGFLLTDRSAFRGASHR